MLWFVIMFAILLSVTRLSSFIQVWLFPPTVKRAYVNDTFTKLRLDD
jgi:hypothetical protein